MSGTIFDTGDSMHPSARATKEGANKEKEFKDLVLLRGNVPCIKYSEFENSKTSLTMELSTGLPSIQDKILVKGIPYNSVYEGSKCRTEYGFYSYLPPIKADEPPVVDYSARIEIKKMDHPGSADEKLGYILLNAQLGRFPENELIIICIGPGCREGAFDFIPDYASKFIKMPVIVFRDMEEAIDYII